MSSVFSAAKTFGFMMPSIMTPWATAMMAATNWAISLTHQRRLMMSSRIPAATMMMLPIRMPCTGLEISANRTTESRKPRKIAIPPMRGIGWVWILRASPGLSIAPTLCAKDLTIGVEPKATTAATAMASSTRSHNCMSGNMGVCS